MILHYYSLVYPTQKVNSPLNQAVSVLFQSVVSLLRFPLLSNATRFIEDEVRCCSQN